MLDKCSIAPRSIEILLHALFFTCFAYFFYLVIYSIFVHHIHAFISILCTPLIIFDHFYISRVKLSSFLYPLSIMTKRVRNCREYVQSFKILYVRGRNTCPYKGELCFILLGGVFTSLFLYTSLVTIFTYIVLIFDIYIYIYIYTHIYDDVCLLYLPPHVLFLFYLYTHISLCMQSFIFVLY